MNGPADQPIDSARPKNPMYLPVRSGGDMSATAVVALGENRTSPVVITIIVARRRP